MMKHIFKQALLIATFGLVVFSIACNDDEDELPQPEASFTSSVNQETGTVTFTNTSQNATTYSWDFGDGTNSTQESPTKAYTTDGDYVVVLTASNSAGDSDMAEETITIILPIPDETAPTLTLLGETEVEVWIGDTSYEDAGAEASDEVDGEINSSIEVGGDEVNVFQPGVYTVTYNVEDAAGNKATELTRTVTVVWEGGGLISNGDFEEGDGTDGWSGEALDVRNEGGNNFAFANPTTAGAPADVSISYALEIMERKSYKLSFNAASDGERTMIVGVGLNEGNFASSNQTINLSSSQQRYFVTVTMAVGSANSRVFFDMGADVGVVTLDNISLFEVDDPFPMPTDAPAAPTVAEGMVKSLFSDVYTDIAVDTWSAEWDDGSQEDVSIAGNTVKKVVFGDTGGFLGVDFSSSAFDATAFTHFHMDYWIANDFKAGQILNPKWSNHDDTKEINAFEYTNAIGDGQSGQWKSIDVPITAFGGDQTRDNLKQLIIATAQTLDVVYLDNIYLYTAEDTGGSGDALFMDDLNMQAAVSSFTKIANADGNAGVSVNYSLDGGVDGSGAIELDINVDAGGAYILRYQKDIDYAGATKVKISYQAKVVNAITGSALHFASQVPNPAGGVILKETFNTENQINDAGFTTVSHEIDGVGVGSIFIFDLNFATGGAATATVLIDNIKVEAVE